jgi:hypothetical protein
MIMKPMSLIEYADYRLFVAKTPCPYTCGEGCVGLEACGHGGRCAVKDAYRWEK